MVSHSSASLTAHIGLLEMLIWNCFTRQPRSSDSPFEVNHNNQAGTGFDFVT